MTTGNKRTAHKAPSEQGSVNKQPTNPKALKALRMFCYLTAHCSAGTAWKDALLVLRGLPGADSQLFCFNHL